jgi:hypothetical protein
VTSVPPAPARQRWLIPALIVVVSVTIGGGLLAREVYKQPDVDPPLAAGVVVSTPPPTSLSPEQQPGPDTVTLTPDAGDHPQGEVLRKLYQSYFDAINQRDYAKWEGTVTEKQGMSQGLGLDGFKSTKDGSPTIYRIETAPDNNLRVLIGFTSTQKVVDAPPELPAPCTKLLLVMRVAIENGNWKIDTVPKGNIQYSPC